MLTPKDKRALLDYIDAYWDSLTVSTPHDTDTHLGLPNKFIAPSAELVDGYVFREQFYWDTYFTILPLLSSERHDIAEGMVENLLHLLEMLGYVPNSNNRWHLGRSQPPLLSMMVRMVYEQSQDKRWLRRAFELLQYEYHHVWMANEHPHNRNVYHGLSRYYHNDRTHRGAEDESGWDYTTRFNGRCLDYLPVDLNALLYKYEIDFSEIAMILGDEHATWRWRFDARLRSDTVDRFMWDEAQGLYYDFQYKKEARSSVASLASYMPMFVGMVGHGQAEALRRQLAVFETEYGLATTAKNGEPTQKKQWATPNGWAPMHYVVVKGLERYGFADDAARIANKWLRTVMDIFKKERQLFEKYNVVNPHMAPTSAVYPDQRGFAWTNAVTHEFIKDYT